MLGYRHKHIIKEGDREMPNIPDAVAKQAREIVRNQLVTSDEIDNLKISYNREVAKALGNVEPNTPEGGQILDSIGYENYISKAMNIANNILAGEQQVKVKNNDRPLGSIDSAKYLAFKALRFAVELGSIEAIEKMVKMYRKGIVGHLKQDAQFAHKLEEFFAGLSPEQIREVFRKGENPKPEQSLYKQHQNGVLAY